MCDNHGLIDDKSWLRRRIMYIYSQWIDDTLGFYLFLGKACTYPVIGPFIRYFACQYGKYFHGGQVAAVEECFDIIERATTITVVDCACRKKIRGCDASLTACIMVNTGADVFSEVKNSKFITAQEARDIINESFQAGLIRNIHHCFSPNIYSICNCCTCCCVPYRLRKEYGVSTAVINGKKIGVLNEAKCRKCLKCMGVCPEGAIDVGRGILHSAKCLGCGLCIPSCPEKALELTVRENQHKAHRVGIIEKFIMYFIFLAVIFPLAAGYKIFNRK